MDQRVCAEKFYDAQALPFEIGEDVLKRHPLSEECALILDSHSLAKSIENRGVREHITLLGSMVLDGWSRYQIAKEKGKPCSAIRFEDTPQGRSAQGNPVLLERAARQ